MNTDTGEFEFLAAVPVWAEAIYVGEVVKLKGSECEVVKIGKRTIELKLMSNVDRVKRIMLDDPRNRHERRAAAKLAKNG